MKIREEGEGMGKRRSIRENKGVQAIIGFAASLSFSSTLSISVQEGREAVAYSNSFLSFFLGILCMFCLIQVKQRLQKNTRWEKWISFLYAFFLTVALHLGKQLETVEHLVMDHGLLWISIIGMTLFFAPIVRFCWQQIGQWQEKKPEGIEQEEGQVQTEEKQKVFFRQKDFWKNLLLLFLCWMPVFLAFYPGAFVYDAADEYVQVATRNFTTHHPLVHVLLLGGFVAAGNKFFGSFNLGIAAYTLVQMLLMAGGFSYSILWVNRRWKKSWIQWIQLAFYGLFPVIPMYVVCSAKDGLFNLALLIVLLQMLTLFEDPVSFLTKRTNWLTAVVTAAGMMLLRNNGKYAYWVWAIAAVVGLWQWRGKEGMGKNQVYKESRNGRRVRIWTVLLFVSALLLYEGIFSGLVFGVKAKAGGSQELLTVPIQQLARSWNADPKVYTKEEEDLLFSFIPKAQLSTYHPRLSDLVKSKFDNAFFGQNKKEFITLWASVGRKKPMTYINAWLMTSYGFWYPDAVINVYGGNTVYTHTYQDSSYFGFETEPPGQRESKLPWLEEEYRKLSLELYQQKIPGISMFFSPGFLFWVFAFCLGFLLYQKRWQRVLPMLLILFVWATFLLGPTYLVRYVLVLWFALPVIVSQLKI